MGTLEEWCGAAYVAERGNFRLRPERELLEAPTRKGPVRKLSKSTLRIAKRYSKMAEEVV